MIDTKALRALYDADRAGMDCPKCGRPAFASDCWQIEALEQAPDMLDEIDRLRAGIAEIAEKFGPPYPRSSGGKDPDGKRNVARWLLDLIEAPHE